MKTHCIKIKDHFADEILSGNKNFEIRYNDRDYQTGDCLIFNVVDSSGGRVFGNRLNGKRFKITYVIGGWGLKDNYVAFGIKEVDHA